MKLAMKPWNAGKLTLARRKYEEAGQPKRFRRASHRQRSNAFKVAYGWRTAAISRLVDTIVQMDVHDRSTSAEESYYGHP